MEVIEWDKKAERQKVYLMRNNKATSKGDQPGSESRALQILALIGPVAAVVASLAWAVSVYFIEREKYRAQVELARLEVEAKKQGFPVS